MKERPGAVLVIEWIIIALMAVTVGMPIVALLLGNVLPDSAADFLTTLAVVFALSGAMLIGSLLAFGLSVAGVLLEVWYLQQRRLPKSMALRSPSALLLLTLATLAAIFFFL